VRHDLRHAGSPLRVSTTTAVVVLALAFTFASPAAPASAQQAGGDDDLPHIRISDPGRDLFRLGLPKVEGETDLAREALDTENRDLDIMGIFRILDPASFPQQLQSEGLGFSSALWSQVGAQGVAKLKVARSTSGVLAEGRLYVTGRGDAPVISRTYRASDVRDAVHLFANDIVEHFTGQRGIFGSRIALALTTRGSREIAMIDMDGSRTTVLTKMGSDCLLPAFSPSGGEIAFTSYLRNNPDL